jgi:hypothetical protein
VGQFVLDHVIPKLKNRLPSFVVDVVMDINERFYVCELNPFATSSSACQFSWSEDKTLLMIGPESWRFQREETSKVEFLSDEWVAWIGETFSSSEILDSRSFTLSMPLIFAISVGVLLVANGILSHYRLK